MPIFKDRTSRENAFDRIITRDLWPPRPSDYMDVVATTKNIPRVETVNDEVPFSATAASDQQPNYLERNRMNVQHASRPRRGHDY